MHWFIPWSSFCLHGKQTFQAPAPVRSSIENGFASEKGDKQSFPPFSVFSKYLLTEVSKNTRFEKDVGKVKGSTRGPFQIVPQ